MRLQAYFRMRLENKNNLQLFTMTNRRGVGFIKNNKTKQTQGMETEETMKGKVPEKKKKSASAGTEEGRTSQSAPITLQWKAGLLCPPPHQGKPIERSFFWVFPFLLFCLCVPTGDYIPCVCIKSLLLHVSVYHGQTTDRKWLQT